VRARIWIGFCCAAVGAQWQWPELAPVRPVMAQVLPRELPGSVEPGRDRPLPEAPSPPQYDFTIETPSRSSVPRAVNELHFLVREIRIEGAEALPPESFRPLYEPLLGQQATVSDIVAVADEIEDAYRSKGYVLARAFMPPQRVTNGVFTIRVIEGFVSGVDVEGGDAATQALIKRYFQPVLASRPLELGAIERALLLANDVPGVSVTGVLHPATEVQGASDLIVTVAETPVTSGLSIDNRSAPFSGTWTFGGDAAVNGIIDAGDQLAVSTAVAPVLREKISDQLRYRHLVGGDGAAASMVVTVTHSRPGAALEPLNLITDSLAAGPRFSYPFLRTREASLLFDGGITVQDAKVQALGGVLSHDAWRVADASLSYLQSDLFGGVLSLTGDIAEGIGVFGATPDGSPALSRAGANPEFTKATATLHYIHPLVGRLSLALAGQGQYAFAPLVAGEVIAFGSLPIGRGYDPGAITGDHGAGGSAELRWDEPLSEWAIQTLEPYVFYDVARVWNIRSDEGASQQLASGGVGMRFYLPRNITAGVELAHTLEPVPGSDNGKRVSKLFFSASVRF
jgi:hemolysin activation/secretion protein